ncbi:hypothetical protein SADUNF_Sadunf16G0158500 [Salix dunnii]|uniref:Flavonoid 3',5'-hydroxylase n=1 Tax=Salix dunnii TaxID=1413687 RepID=A0A835J9Z7_9ROSI|nr:hypothetical protein SADUNF_Sadunf16G0158500 [Salix dunnii]
MPHVTLAKMAKKYGPIMHLKMGTCDMVVASTLDAARAFLKTLDLNFSNRPIDGGPTHLAYNAQDMVFTDYGPRWKLLRKLSSLHMLGGKALEEWTPVRVTELGHMLRAMCEASKKGEPVVVPEMLTLAMANMIGQVILSHRVFVTKGSESNEFKDMVVELMTSAGFFNIGDFIPSDLFTAGTDTSSSVIEWALAEMVKNPSILKRAQDEMDQVIGRNRRLVESDIPRLPYLQALCKETF